MLLPTRRKKNEMACCGRPYRTVWRGVKPNDAKIRGAKVVMPPLGIVMRMLNRMKQ
jgi:hypothetical protein